MKCFEDVVSLSPAKKHKDALDPIGDRLKPLRKALSDAIDAEVAAGKDDGEELHEI